MSARQPDEPTRQPGKYASPPCKIALIDYGVGNLRSVEKALRTVGNGIEICTTSDPEQIQAADKVVLPGVGAFGDGMEGLRQRNLIGSIAQVFAQGKPLLGICLGMQLLFDVSEEMGNHAGLGFLPGRVRRFTGSSLKVPHTGWNQIFLEKPNPLLEGIPNGSYAYFNHSYYCEPALLDDVLGSSEYGIRYASLAGRARVYGLQFHPEKSQDVGLVILRNFITRG